MRQVGRATGGQRMAFEIAGLDVDVVAHDAWMSRACERRYRAFVRAPPRVHELVIDAVSAPPPAFACVRGDGWSPTPTLAVGRAGVTDLQIEERDGSLFFARGDYFGELDADGRSARITCARHVHSMNSALRVLCAFALARRGGFLVHAASIVRGGRAYLFPGESGAGKTTIARLSADAGVLSDEISAVRRVGSAFHCFATPFWGDLGRSREENASAPLEAVLFPVHADEVKLVPITPAHAATRLLAAIVLFGDSPSLAESVFETACDVTRAAKRGAALLHFLPNPSFWSCLGA